jgi:hypothetical protein
MCGVAMNSEIAFSAAMGVLVLILLLGIACEISEKISSAKPPKKYKYRITIHFDGRHISLDYDEFDYFWDACQKMNESTDDIEYRGPKSRGSLKYVINRKKITCVDFVGLINE